MTDSGTIHPVDEVLPLGRLSPLGLQHVLVMCAGADEASLESAHATQAVEA